jgi:hypothetical protein
VALLIILSIVLLAFTTVVVGSLSLNRIRIDRDEKTARVLNQARESLLGYSLRQTVAGSLPCPDTDATADGLENRSGSTCTSQIGRFPYRTVGTDVLVDGSGTPLWYAVAPAYSNNSGLVQRNSSLSSSYFLDANPVTAVVIGPGLPLTGQVRVPITVAGFLEGENANASVDTYARLADDVNNDKLLGIGVADFWSLVERKVVLDAAELLRDYKTACAEFPWAANFNPTADTSVDLLQAGSLPLDSALPADWGSGCASGIAPSAALQFHWRNQLYYSFCIVAEGNCLTIVGDKPGSAQALIVAPGTSLSGQNRAVGAVSDFYEDDNATPGSPYKNLLSRNFVNTFNDVLHVVSP